MKLKHWVKTGLIFATVSTTIVIAADDNSKATQSANAIKTDTSINSSIQQPPSVALNNKKHKDARYTFNLSNANLKAVTDQVSQLTGKNFLVSPEFAAEQRKVTIFTQEKMTADEIYQIYLTALQVLGYSAVPAGNVIKIVKAADAVESAPPLASAAYPGVGNEVVIRVVTANNISVLEAQNALSKLAPASTVIQAYQPNSVILAGYARNVNRLVEILHDLDDNAGGRVQIVPLFNASADKIVETLNKLQGQQGSYNNPVKLAADTQNNNVLVRGNERIRKYYTKLIQRLDMARNTGAGGTEVIHLNYLQAEKLAPVLAKIAQGSIDQLNGQGSTTTSGSPVSISNVAPARSFSSSTLGNNLSDKNDSGPDSETVVQNDSNVVQAVKESNSLVISAPASVMSSLNAVIKELDVAPRQVLVEAIIARIDQNLINQLGIVWGTSNAEQDTTDASGNPTTTTGFKEGVGYIPHGNIRAIVHALQQTVSADVLATPTIVVLDNNEALINDGKNLAMQQNEYAATDPSSGIAGTANDTGTQTGGSLPFSTFTRKNVVLQLKVTPQISPNLRVRLKLAEQDDTVADPDQNANSTLPPLNTSKITTSVMVDDGSIIVLGGLVSHDQQNRINKIPILGDFPILGQLFKHRSKNLEKKDLMVFIRPIILKDKRTRNSVTQRRYNYLRNAELDKNSGKTISLYDPGPVLPEIYTSPNYIPQPFAKAHVIPHPFDEK